MPPESPMLHEMSRKLDKLDGKLDRLDGRLDTLVIWQAGHTEKHETIDRDMDDYKDTLYGNPGGLKSKVDRLWNYKTDVTRWKDFWMYVFRVVIAGGVIGLIVWLFEVFKHILQGG